MDLDIVLRTKNKTLAISGDFDLFKELITLFEYEPTAVEALATKAKLPEKKTWNIHKWSAKWEKDLDEFALATDLSARIRRTLGRAGNLSKDNNGVYYSYNIDRHREFYLQKNYPDFPKAIEMIAMDMMHVNNIGEKTRQKIAIALKKFNEREDE